jgi:hypothetical protein
VAPQRRAPIGRQNSGRLRRGTRLETVRALREPRVQAIGRQPKRAPDGAPPHYETPPPGTDHAVPPGATARRNLHRAGRRRRRRRTAAVRQGRVRRVPRVRHPGPRLPAPALRRLRPRQVGRTGPTEPRWLKGRIDDALRWVGPPRDGSRSFDNHFSDAPTRGSTSDRRFDQPDQDPLSHTSIYTRSVA